MLDVACGDEVIMPSFAFASTANAFVLRGATPVFVDIQDGTLNIDPAVIERAITTRTKAIVALHYAGVACDMDAFDAIASRYGVPVVEDAAQAVLASFHGKPLGGIGALGAFSFHETKNITSGEGGALLVNDPRYASRAEVLWEKGTDRSRFARGEVEKYTWVDVGSSYLPSELVAAFLLAQLEQAESVTMNRLRLWQQYHDALEESEHAGKLRRPFVPEGYGHNAHIYCIRVGSIGARRQVLQELREAGIEAAFHYVPLHSSPAGRRFGRSVGDLQVTTVAADRIIRLPLWDAMTDAQLASVVTAVKEAVARI